LGDTPTLRWGLVGTTGYAACTALPALRTARGASVTSVLSADAGRAKAFAALEGLPRGFGDLVLATGYQARYVPGHQTMQELVAEGAIGDVTVAMTYFGVHRPFDPPPGRTERSNARWGALADLGTHHLDLLRMIVGEVASVQALDAHRRGHETEDAVCATVRFETEALASLSVTTNTWRRHTQVAIHGTAGSLIAEGTAPAGLGRVTLQRPDGDPVDTSGEPIDASVAQAETIAKVIDGAEMAYATGEDGARNVDLLEQMLP
jgi:1,5-anhydro-D-fructose reductase (1,5-anhydro-D-mannitol-forming)